MSINSAAAADGGSLWLEINVGGLGAGYTLNRSMRARGTPIYEQISDEQGPLSQDGLTALLTRLLVVRKTMTGDDPNRRVVDEFLRVLQKDALRDA